MEWRKWRGSSCASIVTDHIHLVVSDPLIIPMFIDWRIGKAAKNRNYDEPSKEDVMLKRILQERVRRSKKREKFSLEGGGNNGGWD